MALPWVVQQIKDLWGKFPVAVANGGTGATTLAAAQAALGLPAAATQAEVDAGTAANKYVSPATLKKVATGQALGFYTPGTYNVTVTAGGVYFVSLKGGGGGGGASGLCRSSSAASSGGGGSGGGSVERNAVIFVPKTTTITCIVGAGGAGGVGRGYTSSYWNGLGGSGGKASRIIGFDMPLLSGGGGGGGGGRVANNAAGNGSGGGGGAGYNDVSASRMDGVDGDSGVSPGGSDMGGSGAGGAGGGASNSRTDHLGGKQFSPAPGPYGGGAIPNNSGGAGSFAAGVQGGGDGAAGSVYGMDGNSGQDGRDGYIVLIKLN